MSDPTEANMNVSNVGGGGVGGGESGIGSVMSKRKYREKEPPRISHFLGQIVLKGKCSACVCVVMIMIMIMIMLILIILTTPPS